MRADLHTHSTASDGTLPPGAVVREAAALGLDVVGLTDHDTVHGWAEAAQAAREAGIALIRGAEISTRTRRASVHLLSYLHDDADQALAAALEDARTARVRRAHEMIRRLTERYDLTWAEVQAVTPPGATVGRPHLADALVAKGVARDRDAVFASILYNGGPFDVPYDSPTPARAIALILGAGGVPVIAHPAAGRRGATLGDEELAALVAVGLAGLEVDHRDHTAAERAHLRGLARELGVFVTGSSDYHGSGKLNRLGENLTAADVVEQIAGRGRLLVIRPGAPGEERP